MEQDKQQGQRRVKKVKATVAPATGSVRAAVKPHKRTTENSVKQLINDYLGSLRAGSLSQTTWGATLSAKAAAARSNFGLAAGDEPYLLLDVAGTGKAGMLLSTTGVHLADGRGGALAISWKDFASQQVGYANGLLTIGPNRIATRDGQVLATLLKQIQTKLA